MPIREYPNCIPSMRRGLFLNCLSVSRREMSHSKFLAELFKEDSFHGIGTLPLQLLMEVILDRAIKQDTRLIECPDKKVMFPSFKSAIMATVAIRTNVSATNIRDSLLQWGVLLRLLFLTICQNTRQTI